MEITGLIWRQSLSSSRRKVFLFNRSLFIKPAGGFVFLTSYTLEEAQPSFSSKDPDWSGYMYMTGWLICQSSSEVMEMMSREIWFKSRCTQEGPAVFHVAVKCPGNSVNSVRHSGCFQIQRWKSKDLLCRRDKREASQDLKGPPDLKCHFRRILEALIESRRSLKCELPRHKCTRRWRRSQLVLMLAYKMIITATFRLSLN